MKNGSNEWSIISSFENYGTGGQDPDAIKGELFR